MSDKATAFTALLLVVINISSMPAATAKFCFGLKHRSDTTKTSAQSPEFCPAPQMLPVETTGSASSQAVEDNGRDAYHPVFHLGACVSADTKPALVPQSPNTDCATEAARHPMSARLSSTALTANAGRLSRNTFVIVTIAHCCIRRDRDWPQILGVPKSELSSSEWREWEENSTRRVTDYMKNHHEVSAGIYQVWRNGYCKPCWLPPFPSRSKAYSFHVQINIVSERCKHGFLRLL